jgi:hypothetical protein
MRKILGDKAYRGVIAEVIEIKGLVFETPVSSKGNKGFAVEAKCQVV